MKYNKLCETCLSDTPILGRAIYCPECEILNKSTSIVSTLKLEFFKRPYRVAYLVGLTIIATMCIGWQAVPLVALATIDLDIRSSRDKRGA